MSQPVVITSGPMDFFSPLPSSDGKQVFVVGEQSRGELVRYDSKSGTFVPYLSGISAQGVSFSRDGMWVAYVAYPEGTLWRCKLDGSERLKLGFERMSAFQPKWSPDGKKIAFMATSPGQPWQIYAVSAHGGSPQRLAAGERNQADPDWSADGNSVAFGDAPGLESDNAAAIHILNLTTREVSKLPGSEGLFSPC